VVSISIILPSCDFVDEGLFAGDAVIEALGQPFGQPPCFGGGKGFIERSLGMGVEIVLHQTIFLAFKKWISAKSLEA
jgi:hypothetical protein